MAEEKKIKLEIEVPASELDVKNLEIAEEKQKTSQMKIKEIKSQPKLEFCRRLSPAISQKIF